MRSHTAGSILWIPRERGMTRLYVELSSADGEKADRTKTTHEYVMARAREAMDPYTLKWKTVEWFGNYVVGQRVARHFMDPDATIFIAGDVCEPIRSIEYLVLMTSRLRTVTLLLQHREPIQACTTVSISHGS